MGSHDPPIERERTGSETIGAPWSDAVDPSTRQSDTEGVA
jgi:hypothetical protein